MEVKLILGELTGWRKVEGYLYPSQHSASWSLRGPDYPVQVCIGLSAVPKNPPFLEKSA